MKKAIKIALVGLILIAYLLGLIESCFTVVNNPTPTIVIAHFIYAKLSIFIIAVCCLWLENGKDVNCHIQ